MKQEVVREEETPEDKVGLEDPADRQEDIKMSEESFTSEELEEHRTIAQDVSSPASPTVLTTDNEEESRDGPEEVQRLVKMDRYIVRNIPFRTILTLPLLANQTQNVKKLAALTLETQQMK